MTFNELILGIIKGLELVFLKMFFFLDEVSRDTNDTIEEDPIGINMKNEVIEENFDVKGHIITEHKDIEKPIVKCTKLKKMLPNDENALQNLIKKIENEVNTAHEEKKSHMCPKCEKSFSFAGYLKVPMPSSFTSFSSISI